MKKITLIFAVIAISASALFAQKREGKEKKSPEDKAQKAATKWKAYLGLTDDQKQKFYEAKIAQTSKMQALKDARKVATVKDTSKAEFKAAKAEFVATVKTIFTPEQFDKWNAKRSEMKDKSKNRREDKGKNKNGKVKNKEPKEEDADDDDDDKDFDSKESKKQ